MLFLSGLCVSLPPQLSESEDLQSIHLILVGAVAELLVCIFSRNPCGSVLFPFYELLFTSVLGFVYPFLGVLLLGLDSCLFVSFEERSGWWLRGFSPLLYGVGA